MRDRGAHLQVVLTIPPTSPRPVRLHPFDDDAHHVGIVMPMPSPIKSAPASSGRARNGADRKRGRVTRTEVAIVPVTDRANPGDGAIDPNRRPMRGLKVEPVRKPGENGRIASPCRLGAVKPRPVSQIDR